MAAVCPWWIGPILASPYRKRRQDPNEILGPWVREGMTVLEPGPGMGYFTIPLATLVGRSGRIICVDLQKQMLAGLVRRAKKKQVADRIETRLCSKSSLEVEDLAERADFALAFAVVHEVPDAGSLFRQIAGALKKGGRLLLAEPAGHVSKEAFAVTLNTASNAGLVEIATPQIGNSLAAVLEKT